MFRYRAMFRIAIAATLLSSGVPHGLPAQQPIATVEPTAKYQVTVEKNIMVAARDGVKLATDLYRPTGAGAKLPVILMRTPYNKDAYRGAIRPAEIFAGQGYIAVIQDTRGKFHSDGEYEVQTPDRNDGYDAIDWIVKQPWSTGKVGTYGCSYLGEVQYLLSKMHHPNHTAAIAQSASGAVGPAGGYYTNFGTLDGGALVLSSLFGWFGSAGSRVKGARAPLESLDFPTLLRSLPLIEMGKKAGYPPSELEEFFSQPPAAPFWDRKGYLRDDDKFNTPMLHVNSWLDVTPEQTLYVFNLMQKNAMSATAKDNQFAIMSPTTHCQSERATEHTKVGDMDVGDARFDYWKVYVDWFDHWLKGTDNGVTRMPRVRYYVMGKEWRTAPSWPAPEMKIVPYYLTSGGHANTSKGDGGLTTTKPSGAGSDSYVYDPNDPVPSRGGTICCTGNAKDLPGIFDQADIEASRQDILVYSTAPLGQGVTIAGTVKAALHFSSDAKDTDLTLKLLDVDPQGRSWNVLNGVLRLRYREGMAKKVLLQPGQTYRIEVSLKATAYHFAPGHRIRLWVTSSDFPLYDRNLNTGGNNYDETTWVKAKNAVHYGAATPSALMLPMVP